MKRKKLLICFFIIALIVFLFMGAIIRNDFLSIRYANQLYKIPLPTDTIQISKDKFVGNLYGNGNHLDFAAVIEIKSSFSEGELIDYYSSKNEMIKSADELSIMGLKAYPDNPIDHTIQKIEVIPKANAVKAMGSSVIFEKSDIIDDTIDKDLFIVQIKDTHYGSNWDLRTH